MPFYVFAAYWWMFDWGDVPTWLGAIATLLALAGATVAAWIGYRVYLIESERDRRVAEERREAQQAALALQANRVSVWIEQTDALTTTDVHGIPTPVVNLWRVTVRNASDLPVYAVKTTLVASTNTGEVFELLTMLHPVVPPGDEETDLQDGQIFSDLPDHIDPIACTISVRLRFRDSATRWWIRDSVGRLKSDQRPGHTIERQKPATGHTRRVSS